MEYNKVFKIAAFDLDGTLLDSADDLIYSLNILLKEKNQPLMKKNNVYRLVGNGALAMIKEAYRLNNNKEDIDWSFLQKRFLEIYKTQFLNKSTLYPYTENTLKSLKENKINMIIVSNKPSYFVKKILKHYKISKYFDAVSGGDTFKLRKPDP